jgi:hypothetical protein
VISPPNRVLAAIAAAALGIVSSVYSPLRAGELSPIQRAVIFLYRTQVTSPVDVLVNGARTVDFPGDWPQYFTLAGGDASAIRDVSPFTVVFVHHALSKIVEENSGALGLTRLDLDLASAMRRRAVRFAKAFASPAGAPDAGTFAFWPYDADPATPSPLLTFFLTAWLRGPILGGSRVPINLPIYPSTLAIPSDADVTATTYATLLDDALHDGGAGSRGRFEQFFVDWRDLGIVPRRVNPSWLPPASGTFLTWLTYRDRVLPLFSNDVDLVVNANVLYALARYHRLNVPGAAEAMNFINLAAASGLHRHIEQISQYYPDNFAFQYAVSRAFHEGPVPQLEPAVRILADDLERSVRFRTDGAAYWDHGDPHLNTAFAVLTLLNAGRHGALVDRAIDYLAAEQNPLGGFDASTFFLARTDGGPTFEFTSAPFTTAMALEAFARHQEASCREVAGPAPNELAACGTR